MGISSSEKEHLTTEFKKKKMKFFAATMATNSYILNHPQSQCGDEMCGTASGRHVGSQVCMRVDEEVDEYYDHNAGEIGEERCFCIYAFRWHQKNGRNWPVVASKTPECAFAYLSVDLNIVAEEAHYQFANSTNTNNRCDGATTTKNGDLGLE